MTPQEQAPLLVIEDEPAVLAFVAAALERNGFTVECVSSGTAALEKLDSGAYCGVVTDIRMPGGVDGADVYDWLQHNRPLLARRCLFITGDTVNEETALTLRRSGAPCVEKPFRVSDLISAVRRLLEVAP